jgi:hypothetical protein
MHIQIVEFELQGIGRSEYERRCDELAPVFASLPGLLGKAWIVDPDSNRAGGVYGWADAAAAAYAGGELFAAVRADPQLANLRSRSYAVLGARPR